MRWWGPNVRLNRLQSSTSLGRWQTTLGLGHSFMLTPHAIVMLTLASALYPITLLLHADHQEKGLHSTETVSPSASPSRQENCIPSQHGLVQGCPEMSLVCEGIYISDPPPAVHRTVLGDQGESSTSSQGGKADGVPVHDGPWESGLNQEQREQRSRQQVAILFQRAAEKLGSLALRTQVQGNASMHPLACSQWLCDFMLRIASLTGRQ